MAWRLHMKLVDGLDSAGTCSFAWGYLYTARHISTDVKQSVESTITCCKLNHPMSQMKQINCA